MENRDTLGGEDFRFKREKGSTDKTGILRIISAQTPETDEELCACFIHWQKASDRVNWIKLMQIMKKTSIDWRERSLITKLYMDQSVKVRLDQV